MITLKTNIMQYKDVDGRMKDVGAIVGGMNVPIDDIVQAVIEAMGDGGIAPTYSGAVEVE